jgi:glyoxylase-like metal-dependent hydrolase (beta-lactamase superfamily II)
MAAAADATPALSIAMPTFNNEAVLIFHPTSANTDADSFVMFRKSDVIAAGDVYRTDSYPVIDVDAGGTTQGLIDALNHILDLTVPSTMLAEGGTYVIPGHGRLADEADVVEMRDMTTIIRDRFQDAIKKGRTLEQVKTANLLKDYEGRYGASEGFWTTNSFIEAVYASLKPAAPAAPTRAPGGRSTSRNQSR